MAPFQLEWAALQASEDRGNTPRKNREAQAQDKLQADSLALLAWIDNHISRRP